MVGTAGPQFSFSAAVMLGTNDLVAGGYVIRNGDRFQARDVDIVIGIEPDNVTARTATVAWTLDNGETVIIDCEPLGGWMLGHGQYLESDQLARFTVRGTEIEGWCDIEVPWPSPAQSASPACRRRRTPARLLASSTRIDLFEKLVTT